MFCSRCGAGITKTSKFCPSCGLDLASQTPLGRTVDESPESQSELDVVQQALAEEYDLQQELGRGGMAIVFRARDKQLDRDVAVKVLPASLAFDAEFVERFQREARTSARLEHPNIIPIYRVGKAGRVIYFTMKFLRGGSLSDQIEQKGPMAPDDIRRLLIQTGGALGYAHKNEIVHRDIKPDNIMFDELGHSVVTDFGIAKAATGTRLTGTGMSIGTPHYMSPEQARAQPLDGRSDMYSLGVVAYQCLTGRVPFDGEDAFSIGYKHIMEEVEAPDLPSADHRRLFGVIRHMMAKHPEERFQNAQDLVAELEGSRGSTATEPAPAMPRMSEAATVAMPSMPQARGSTVTPTQRPSTPTTPMPRPSVDAPPAKTKTRRPLLAASLVLLLLGGGGAGGWYYANNVYCPGAPEAEICAMIPGVSVAIPAPIVPDTTARLVATDSATTDSATVGDSTAVTDSLTLAAADTAPIPTTGVLRVVGVPSGARIALGRGQFGTQRTFDLDAGTHQVRVRATGFQDYTGSVSVAPGDTTEHTVSMRAAAPDPPPARGQCDNPQAPRYNDGQLCFDRAPRLEGVPALNVTSVTGALPTTLTVFVQLNEGGQFVRAVPAANRDLMQQYPALAQVSAMAVRYLQQANYSPATKAGSPVAAWFQVLLRLQR